MPSADNLVRYTMSFVQQRHGLSDAQSRRFCLNPDLDFAMPMDAFNKEAWGSSDMMQAVQAYDFDAPSMRVVNEFLDGFAEAYSTNEAAIMEYLKGLGHPLGEEGVSMESKQESILQKARKKVEQEVLQIEQRTDLTQDQKVSRIIHTFSAVCAGVAVQPIPFADIFVLTPIQAYMGSRLAAIEGVPVSEAKAGEIVKELAGVIGLGVLAQQLAIGAYKTFIPFLGALTTIPMVYGLTYGVGRVMNAYFVAKSKGERLSKEQIKAIWDKERRRGNAEGKKHSGDIKSDAQDLSV